MSGGITVRNKLNTFRILQEEISDTLRRQKKSSLAWLVNQANILLIVIAGLATYGTIDLARKTDSLWIALVTLGLQTFAVILFFVSKQYDWLSTRLLLFSYIVFYAVVLFAGDGISIAPYWMFTYVLFAFVGAGAKEGFVWIGLHASLLSAAVYIDQTSGSPSLSEEAIPILIVAYALVTAFAYLMDYTARIVRDRIQTQSLIIEELNARYDTILNNAGEGLLAINEKGITEFINESALKLLRTKSEDAIGQHFEQVIHLRSENGEPLDEKSHPIWQSLKSHKPLHSVALDSKNIKLQAKSKTLSVAYSVNPVHSGHKFQGVVMLFRDSSHEEQINRTKNEFVSLASHQLRTPLNVTTWYLEKLMTQKKGKLNTAQVAYLQELERNNQRMIHLVADLLTVSRLDLGKTTRKFENVNFSPLFDTLIDEVHPLIKEKRIQLDLNITNKNIELKNSDQSFVTVIIQNLLSNAVKYTPANGKIIVTIREVKTGQTLLADPKYSAGRKGLLLSVRDSGIGIPKEQQDKIFSKLFRADNAQVVDVSGTGLGLYVTQQFAEQLYGNVWFTSEENKGSQFSVYLPYDSTDERSR